MISRPGMGWCLMISDFLDADSHKPWVMQKKTKMPIRKSNKTQKLKSKDFRVSELIAKAKNIEKHKNLRKKQKKAKKTKMASSKSKKTS